MSNQNDALIQQIIADKVENAARKSLLAAGAAPDASAHSASDVQVEAQALVNDAAAASDARNASQQRQAILSARKAQLEAELARRPSGG